MKKLVIFASGSGTNFEAIVEAITNKEIDATISLLVCDKPKAYAVQRAKNHNIPCLALKLKDFSSKEEYETAIVKELDKISPDLICLAGYMKFCGKVLLDKYEGKIINIHPALLPSFPGAHGIADAYNYGVKVFGVTIHYVDSGVDSGKIIAQEAFNYTEGDSLEEVEKKIHAIEHKLYPKTIKKLLEVENEKSTC